MTITLQDVVIILRLHIHESAVTGTCVFDIAELCGELLGVTPPADADEVTLELSAHGFILVLMGSFLFVDKKGVHVHLCFLPLLRDLTQTAAYSWGGAILAQLYQELCRASLDRRHGISSCITLLHVSITLFYYIHFHIHNTSLYCLLTFCLFCIQLWS